MHFEDGTAIRVKAGWQRFPGGARIAADHRTRICCRKHVSWILVIEFNAPYGSKCTTVCDAPGDSVRTEAIQAAAPILSLKSVQRGKRLRRGDARNHKIGSSIRHDRFWHGKITTSIV